jgi:hypothetical protein
VDSSAKSFDLVEVSAVHSLFTVISVFTPNYPLIR